MIKDLLLNRFTLVCGGAGMLIALIFGLFNGVLFGTILIRMLIGGILMIGVALGLQFLLPKFIGEENLKVLFPNWKSNESGTYTDNTTENSEDGGFQPRVDITEKDDMTVDDLYKDGLETSSDNDYSAAPVTHHLDDMDDTPVDKSKFQESDFEKELPRVLPKDEGTVGPGPKFADDTDAGSGGDYANDEFNRMKTRAKDGPDFPQSAQSESNGSAPTSSVFKVGNKRITADASIIAKAIRTVIKRDS